jgi:hypothetical protein
MVGGNTAELCDDYIGSIKSMIDDIATRQRTTYTSSSSSSSTTTPRLRSSTPWLEPVGAG